MENLVFEEKSSMVTIRCQLTICFVNFPLRNYVQMMPSHLSCRPSTVSVTRRQQMSHQCSKGSFDDFFLSFRFVNP